MSTTDAPITTQPAETRDAELYATALAWVNLTRAEFNAPPLDELPPARPASAEGCTLARALWDAVSDGTTCEGTGSRRYEPGVGGTLKFSAGGQLCKRPIPADVVAFMRRFDAGKYPDLIRPYTPPSATVTVGPVP